MKAANKRSSNYCACICACMRACVRMYASLCEKYSCGPFREVVGLQDFTEILTGYGIFNFS